MRKQLHEVQEIDRYIFRTMTLPDRLLFQAQMILQPELREKLGLQRKTHAFLRWVSRNQKEAELASMYTRLMGEVSFKTRVESIFS